MKRITFILLVALFCLTGCEQPMQTLQGFSMDAPYSIRTEQLSEEQKNYLKEYLNQADSVFDAYRDGSLLSDLNHYKKLAIPHNDPQKQMLYEIISMSLPYCNRYFDISIRPITKLWIFNTDTPSLPNAFVIGENLTSVDYRNIVLEDDFIYLENNAEIELGGVAKGFVCENVAEYLKGTRAIIDIGGTVKATEKDITAGVKSPTHTGLLCSFTLPAGKAVSTSGSYERCFTVQDKTYHHIIDPKTGYPFDSDYISVSVICDSALEADILSTTYFAMENPQLPQGVEAIFVSKYRGVYVTDGIQNFKLLDTSYRIINGLQE